MKFDFDLSTVPVLKPVPDGIYALRIITSKDMVSKTSGNPMIQWECEILEPKPVIVDGAPVEKFFHYSTITHAALPFLRELFEACDRLIPGRNQAPEDLYGSVFLAHIAKVHDQQRGEQNQIRKMFKVGAAAPTFITAE